MVEYLCAYSELIKGVNELKLIIKNGVHCTDNNIFINIEKFHFGKSKNLYQYKMVQT